MKLGRTLALAAAAGALFYVGFAAYSGFHKVMDALARYAWATAAGALTLAAINYLLRFAKWELYLRRLGVRIPIRDSFGIFLSGFSLTVTPGKVGEVLKSYLLREAHGVPMARTAPIVVAERLTDLVALALLALIGVGSVLHGAGGERVAWVALALVGVAVACVASEKLAHAVDRSRRRHARRRQAGAQAARVLRRDQAAPAPEAPGAGDGCCRPSPGCASASPSGWSCAASPEPRRRSSCAPSSTRR